MRGSIKGGRGIGWNFLASVMWQKRAFGSENLTTRRIKHTVHSNFDGFYCFFILI